MNALHQNSTTVTPKQTVSTLLVVLNASVMKGLRTLGLTTNIGRDGFANNVQPLTVIIEENASFLMDKKCARKFILV